MPYFDFQGSQVFYTTSGTGPLLIILPGNTVTSAAHDNEITRYSSQYCTASMDFLGTGKSDRLDRWSSDWWEQGSHQAAALIDHLHCDEAALLGVSGGACIKGSPGDIACPFLLTFSANDRFLPNVTETAERLKQELCLSMVPH